MALWASLSFARFFVSCSGVKLVTPREPVAESRRLLPTVGAVETALEDALTTVLEPSRGSVGMSEAYIIALIQDGKKASCDTDMGRSSHVNCIFYSTSSHARSATTSASR